MKMKKGVRKSLFNNFKDSFIRMVTSRLFVLLLIVMCMGGVLVHRIFQLQIVNGETYLNNFKLKIRKERSIASTRGNIYDRNGERLAYNELAYSVTIEDVYESGNTKNLKLNKTIYDLIKIVEKNNDKIINDFKIVINDDNNFSFTVSDTQLLRFLADVYGHSLITELKYAEKTATPDDVIKYLAGYNYYGIGGFENVEKRENFQVGLGYTKEELLKILTIRYAMSANGFQKYIPTKIASDVSEETVAVVMENSNYLDGVNITEDTIRKYVDSLYFSSILGYTGRASQEELDKLKVSNSSYMLTDMIGKSGIENEMELELQGKKGSEIVLVDNLGKVIESNDRIEPIAGNDLYLTIDKSLQEATYHILEQKIAGILVSKIQNIKEYIPKINASASEIIIPIYDVYFALFNNNVIKFKDLSDANAEETERIVYENFLARRDLVCENLRNELSETATIYNKLTTEYKVYESFIVTMLESNNVGIIQESMIDTSNATYIAWKTDENISLNKYLNYAISMNWIDITKLEMDSKYSDSEEIYQRLLDYIFDNLYSNTEFSKKIIKYMVKDSSITGKQVCELLCEQGAISVTDEDYQKMLSGATSPYNFLLARISNLEITPAQLALDPCSGSVVVTNVGGEVLALVSYPGYDANRLANNIDADYYSQITSDLSNPLWNYATQQRSAPGSTYKMVTASAGLEEGVISTTSKTICVGTYERLSPTLYKCWNLRGHGAENVVTAIRDSCNFFFYEVGYKLSWDGNGYDSDLGIEKLAKYADLFGLSETSGIEITELAPRVSTEYSVPSAIGQGNNDYTTVGLARYVTTVANSGTCYNLSLLDKLTDSFGNIMIDYSPKVRNVIEFQDSTWNVLHLGMREVIEGKAYYKNLGINVAGKTGTAQESYLRPSHALFVCYAPYERPEIAIATRIAYGYASDYAAETTRDVIKYYYNLEDEKEIVTGTADQLDATGNNRD